MPAFRLRVVARAERQIRSASDWWTENRRAVSGLLRDELERAFHLITTQPGAGAPALDVGLEGVRRLHLSGVHYHLYYRVLAEEETVEVLAFWHTSREGEPTLDTDAG